jgi:purine-binding chemotaxis protein CheW
MSTESTRQLVVFSLGEEEYALPISYVHEIIRYAAPRTVASSDPSVCGVISLRGKIIPVFDLATRLGLEKDRAEQAKIVIVETVADGESALAGVVVDDVEEVITVDEEQIDSDGGRTVTGAAIDGIAKIDDRLVVLLSPEQIVATASRIAERAAADEAAASAAPSSSDVAVAA